MLNELTKKKQKIIMSGLIFIGLVLAVLIVVYLDQPTLVKKKEEEEFYISTASDKVDPQEVWRGQMEEDQVRLKELIADLKAEINDYRKQDEASISSLSTQLQNFKYDGFEEEKISNFANQVVNRATEEHVNKITKLKLNLTEEEPVVLRTIDNTIPAGSFVTAKLLSGVDASTSINSQSDPRPILVRLVDDGTLPREFKSDLLDCHCTASAWGELSSERIHARLEKLSCVERSTGEILETDVKGYIAGSDGREGIRGIVVSKDGQFLSRSLWGGVFAGIGNVLSPNNRRQSTTALFDTNTEKAKVGDLFSSGISESAADSLSNLSEYYIKRAEQIQPVIEVAAGQDIDLVFTESVSIDLTMMRKKLASYNDVKRIAKTERLNEDN